ncbi:Putative Methionine-r-sulfoxide reductase [[Torrubiella] hemipterigena]|uniref:Peptide-methionine (R)-S-oxide reductase n=1 Tax=[Torrubiella] hemipterigena TaxID=1531966 RepID=A0A0A1TJN2_9HYPO|nr:Putative Methionine-r-sulfoxide reductase [[Torrubiella] hemipterigena]
MRLSPIFRTLFYSVSNLGRFRAPTSTHFATLRPLPLRSMSGIPFIGALFGSSSSKSSSNMTYPDQRTDDEWRAVLNKEQFRVLRKQGTEAPGSGTFDKHYPSEGVYTCAGCAAPLYKANHKFKSGCGWPAYFDSIPGAVTRHEDRTLGMLRTEIVCSNCGGHLGHVFKGEGFDTPTDERHCVNSVSLNFSADDKPVAKESKA